MEREFTVAERKEMRRLLRERGRIDRRLAEITGLCNGGVVAARKAVKRVRKDQQPSVMRVIPDPVPQGPPKGSRFVDGRLV